MSITSANSVFMLTIPKLYPVPQRLQGYSADDAFMVSALKMTESLMGVDGKKSTGYVPNLYEMEITLQADSSSGNIFDFWASSMKVAQDDFPATATITLPGLGKSYVCTNGSLEEYMPIPDNKKVLQPRKFKITWESIMPAVA